MKEKIFNTLENAQEKALEKLADIAKNIPDVIITIAFVVGIALTYILTN